MNSPGRALLVLLFCFTLLHPVSAAAKTKPAGTASSVEKQYGKIKADYREFLRSEGKKTYRHYWLRHIDSFLRLQRRHPRSPRADDALYMAAGAYVGLYKYSFLKEDLRDAVKVYSLLVKKYPRSNLADDAMVKTGEAQEKLGEPGQAYQTYARCRSQYPKGDLTPKARRGEKRLARYAPKKPPPKAPPATPAPAPSIPREYMPPPPVATPAPSPLSEAIAEAIGGDTAAPPVSGPQPPVEVRPLEMFAEPTVRYLRHWTNPGYTRIVIELSERVSYEHHLLEKRPGKKLPRRLYLDFAGARLGADLPGEIVIDDGLLRRVRIGQYEEEVVRVVLDIESIDDFQIFPLLDPFRVVIDVQGERKIGATPIPKKKRRWTVVLDAGHGGKDPGAMSRGNRESTLTLAIAKKTERELAKDKDIKVIMTRRTDRYLTLPQRPAIANKADADLFVSIHVNAASNRDAQGIEVYHFAPRAGKDVAHLVAAENATDLAGIADIGDILIGLTLSYKKIESNNLATMVQKSSLAQTRRMYRDVRRRKIDAAPFYVLMGARMPAILVECGFITNRTELKRLKSARYQRALAKGIADGIRAYFAEFD